MTNRRATHRRRAREAEFVPVVPGVIPDRSEASIDLAMRQAHEVLPEVRYTRVTIQLHTPAEGLALIGQHFGEIAVSLMQHQLEQIGGEEPTIVIATRLPHRTFHHHERPTT